MPKIENEGVSIVILGSFNPSIFQPGWLASYEMIRREEAESATITIVQSQITDFQTEWFRMQVLQNRFLLQSLDATLYGPLRDLAASIFRLLSHTPVNKLGVSRWFHFEMKSEEAWHGVGHALAPKAVWGKFMKTPGMRSLLIEGFLEDPAAEGSVIFVRTEPSQLIKPGVFMEVTEEFGPKVTAGEVVDASWVPVRLNKRWDSMMKYAENVSVGVLAEVLNSINS